MTISIPIRALLSAAILGLMAMPALAQTGSFVDVLTRDPATTNTPNRLCYATNGRVDIGCPATAPYLNPANGFLGVGNASPTALLDVSGTVAARGGLIIGRTITSSRIWGLDAATYISFHWGQPDLTFHTNGARRMVIASTNLEAEYGGRVGIGNITYPSTTLHVSGTLRIANSGETCDTNRLGAIRYAGGRFDICQNATNGWEPLATTGENSVIDRITSSSMAGVTANSTGYISLTTGGVTGTAYFSPNSVLVNRGISATESVSATRGYFTSNVGIGTPAPTAPLDVSGAIKISGDGTEACGSFTDNGKMRINPLTGRLQVCID